MREFNKFVKYMFNMKKLSYTYSNQLENIRENVYIHNNNKLQRSWTKSIMNDVPRGENHKAFLKDPEVLLTRGKVNYVHGWEGLSSVKITILPTLISKCKVILCKTPARFLGEFQKANPKITDTEKQKHKDSYD